MKRIILGLGLLLMCSCIGGSKENVVYLPDSSGNINNLTLIVENDLWTGEVGEALRKVLAAPVHGLPQVEPLFSIHQMPPQAFSGFVRKNRTFLKIEKGSNPGFKVLEDPYARPQTGVIISGDTNGEIIALVEEHGDSIVKAFKATEIKEKQRRIRKSLKDDSRLQEELGLTLDFPTAYRYAKDKEGFFWIRKDIPHGSMEILIYEVPRHVLEKDTNTIGNIIAMRDSIGEHFIPGPLEGTYMITEEAYAPYLLESKIDGKFAWETKGTWEVKNAFMAGPFLNYAVLDKENDRYVILEGFTFAPSASKRENMQELEAIIRSAEISDEDPEKK